MTFGIEVCDDDQLWDAFVAESPHGSIFCSSSFIDALDEPFVRYIVRYDGAPILAIPVNESAPNFVPFASYTTYRFAIYQGPMFSRRIAALPAHSRTPLQLKCMEFALDELAQKHSRLTFTLSPDFTDLRAFQWFNYHDAVKGRFDVHLRYTARLDLAYVDDSYQNQIRHLRRREVQRAAKSGIIYEATNDLDVLDQLEDLVYERQGLQRDLADSKARRKIADQAMASGFGQCFVARLATGETCSAYLCIYDKDTVYYLFAGNDPDARKTGASAGLMLHVLNYFKIEGKKRFDFIGMNSPLRGDFKSSFNAEACPCFLVNWSRPNS